eukprot:CAMPEP_0119043984 /NCGR_PEP_ID=MMETSP1177-20130426/27685_1 /TAXON_ID=2985 /ORGANISM="Ochromonas sp, Strain CCMP1899" /LENGTH=241 /DNA_ID=CAMNT_0007013279 /DNA_START=77 /DNA_END=802 /DNA_ORIENTATION=-
MQITVLDNPTAFTNPFQFEITFECLQELQDDLEWKVIYVASAEDANADQVLEEVMVGPVPVGFNKFVMQAPAPDHTLINDLIGVTVVLVTCSFMDQEFIRIGYYVNNEYTGFDPENPPNPLEIDQLFKSILHDQPRVTRFAIDWTGGGGAVGFNPASQPLDEEANEGSGMEQDDLVPEDDMVGDDEEGDEEEEDDDDDEVDLEDDEEADETEGLMAVEEEDSMDVLQMQNQGSNAVAPNFY